MSTTASKKRGRGGSTSGSAPRTANIAAPPSTAKPSTTTASTVSTASKPPSKIASATRAAVVAAPTSTAAPASASSTAPVDLNDFPPLPTSSGPATPRSSVSSMSTSPRSSASTPATRGPSLAAQANAMLEANAANRASAREQLKKMQSQRQAEAQNAKPAEGGEGRPVSSQSQRSSQSSSRVGSQPPSQTHSRTQSQAGEFQTPVKSASRPSAHTPVTVEARAPASLLSHVGEPAHDAVPTPVIPSTRSASKSVDNDYDDDIDLDASRRSNNSSIISVGSRINRTGSGLNTTKLAANAFSTSAHSASGSNGLTEEELSQVMMLANDASLTVPKAAYTNAARLLLKLQSAILEAETELHTAGELGEAVCAENSKLEASITEMTQSLEAQIDENKRLDDTRQRQQLTIQQLTEANRKLTEANMKAATHADSRAPIDNDSETINEFIRTELSSSSSILDTSYDSISQSSSGTASPMTNRTENFAVTGNLVADLATLQRKLRRERRLNQRKEQALEAAMQQSERDRSELHALNQRLEAEVTELKQKAAEWALIQADHELKEEQWREREESLNHELKMKLASARKTLDSEVSEAFTVVHREREERERELARRQEAESKLLALHQKVDLLTKQLQDTEGRLKSVQTAKASEEDKRKKLDQELTKLLQSQQSLKNNFEQAEEKSQSSESELKRLQSELSEIQATMADMNQEIVEYREKLAQSQNQINEKNERILALTSEINSSKSELSKEQSDTKTELTKVRDELAKAREEFRSSMTLAEQTRKADIEATLAAAEQSKTEAVTKAVSELRVEWESKSNVISAESAIVSENVTPRHSLTTVTMATPATPSSSSTPQWQLPNPTFPMTSKDAALLRGMFSFLIHQWTIALLLLPSNTRVKKTVDWIDDSKSSTCLSCRESFSLFRPRHHCRLCGGLFCGDCSNSSVTLKKFKLNDVRVCQACFGVVDVLNKGESLIVNKTKVQQKMKNKDAAALVETETSETTVTKSATRSKRATPSTSTQPSPVLSPKAGQSVTVSLDSQSVSASRSSSRMVEPAAVSESIVDSYEPAIVANNGAAPLPATVQPIKPKARTKARVGPDGKIVRKKAKPTAAIAEPVV